MVASELPPELGALTGRILCALRTKASEIAGEGGLHSLSLTHLHFNKVTDPGNHLPGYEGVWRDERKSRCGSLTFNSDGSYYAEYDLFMTHPFDARWFVEMVTVWGRGDVMRAEFQMSPTYSDVAAAPDTRA